MPHGGWKNSGHGRFNGLEGIREFTQIKVRFLPSSVFFPFFL
jgi:acyl-CoA reductase-like NAD-dependent aldehyde dehydrogenase